MNINNENKLHELSLYSNMNLNNININKEQNINKSNNKDNNNLSNSIGRIQRKVTTMNYKQRELQERISYIQTQEAKIYQMEQTLENAKRSYSEKLKNERKETSNIKVRIKQLTDKENKLENKSDNNIKNNEKELKDEEAISIIEDTLNKIQSVKNQIAIYKSKLISLEHSIEQAVSRLESSKLNKYNDFIESELNFISINYNNNETIINIEI